MTPETSVFSLKHMLEVSLYVQGSFNEPIKDADDETQTRNPPPDFGN